MTKQRFILVAFLGLVHTAFGADLSSLKKGQHVSLVMIGQGPLCEGKVDQGLEEGSVDGITVQLSKTSRECGTKNALLRIADSRVDRLLTREGTTKKRNSTKVLLGMAGAGALIAVPFLVTSNPKAFLFLAPAGFAGTRLLTHGSWRSVPKREDFVLLIACPDRLHCFVR